jgi:hypothetical protein
MGLVTMSERDLKRIEAPGEIVPICDILGPCEGVAAFGSFGVDEIGLRPED